MPYGIALDLNSQQVFVAVRSYPAGEGYVVAFDMGTNGSDFRLVAASDYMRSRTNASFYSGYYTSKEPLLLPERLLLDPVGQWVYYTDSGTNNLRRVKYDGTSATTVINGRLHTPVGMAIDFGHGPPRYAEYYDCYGHGVCTGFTGEFKCVCYEGWHGNCDSASCPMGPAWFDEAISTNKAHRLTECSNRGTCDRLLGICRCQKGFEGVACERLSCPNDCNGHGRCLSMAEMADYALDAYGSPGGFTYGSDPTSELIWDANAFQGCYCDRFGYLQDNSDKVADYTGYDCSQRMCPHGDDPTTRNTTRFEVQELECYAEGGTYTLSFRGSTTEALAWNTTISDVQAALQRLPTIGDIEVGKIF